MALELCEAARRCLAEISGAAPLSEQPRPQLIRVDVNAGHGAGKPTRKIIEEAADIYAFIAEATGAEWVA